MEQRDFMMRHIEQLGEALGKLVSKLLRIKGGGQEAATMANQYFAENLGFDTDTLCSIEDDRLMDVLQNMPGFDRGNLDKFADLLMLAAEKDLTRQKGSIYRKSLVIHKYLDGLERSEKSYSLERNHKIKILESLADFTD